MVKEKKSIELIRAERQRLKVKPDQKWLHKSSGAVCKIVNTSVDCETQKWIVHFEFILSNRYLNYDEIFGDERHGLVFNREYDVFINKFDALSEYTMYFTRDEYQKIKDGVLNEEG